MNSENKTLTFKTNINCDGCVAKVAPFLNNADGICHWQVDTSAADKTLSVHSEGITAEQIIKEVNNAGFKIEPINQE